MSVFHVYCVQELKELGGLKNIKVELPDWPVSDDTVLHLATAEGLATGEVQVSVSASSFTHSVAAEDLIGLSRS